MQTIRSLPAVIVLCLIALAPACATGPEIRVDMDPKVDLRAFKTFAFFDTLSTDRGGYATLVSQRLKQATRPQLEQRGFAYNETDPDLRVNFFVRVVDKQEIRSTPGYYGYRAGYYGAWAGYPYNVETIQYREGTLSIDLVDARRKQLVWQGIAEGQVSDETRKNPGPAIDQVVAQIFSNFPYPPR
jgi:hypothetical protein